MTRTTRFRRIFRVALAAVPRFVGDAPADGSDRAVLVGSYYANVLKLLHAHHEAEDPTIYPRMVERMPRHVDVISRVNVEHEKVRRLAAFPSLGAMTVHRMDNVAIVVDDLDAAIEFFTELGMELENKGRIEGLWVDHTVGLDGVRSDIAMMRTPDGHSKLELTKYHAPAAVNADPPNPPPNTLGMHRVMFAVDDIDDTIARLRTHGAELLGEVAQYENIFRLCYLRGPAGIIVALAERIG